MKLLDKKQIAVQKQKERKADIDEGIKLAKRVDALREIQAEEEKSLSAFRDRTLKQLHAEIGEATAHLNRVKRDAEVIEHDLQAREQAVTHRETVVANKEKENLIIEDLLHKKRDELVESEKIIRQQREAVEKDQIRIAGELEEARLKSDDAHRFNADAQANLFASRGIIAQLDAREAQLKSWHETETLRLQTWESNLTAKEAEVIAMQNDVATREAQLRDKYYALEIAQNHVKRSIPRPK